MSAPFEIETFEEHLNASRDDLPEGSNYLRGFVKQPFPDLDGIAKRFRYPVFESKGSL